MLFNLLQKYNKNKVFIETGTLYGHGVIAAYKTNMFDEIHTIEIKQDLYNACVEKYKGINTIKFHLGDSGVVLKKILDTIDEPVTFWLDGHYSAGNTGCAENYLSPIQQELDIIKNSKNREKHTIIVDDINCFTQEMIDMNWDVNKKEPGYMIKSELEDKIKDINKNYNIFYEDNQLIASP